MDRKIIKQEAIDSLVGKRMMLLAIILLISLISAGLMIIGIGIIIAPLLLVGLFYIVTDILNKKEIDINRFKEPFKDLNYIFRVVIVYLLVGLIILVGTFLLIVPGVIFGLMFGQALFVIAEDKEISIIDALKKSKEIMDGYKMDLFIFVLSFIGHFLLGIITFGIYFLYFAPYFQTALTNYYLHLTKQNLEEVEIVREAEFTDNTI